MNIINEHVFFYLSLLLPSILNYLEIFNDVNHVKTIHTKRSLSKLTSNFVATFWIVYYHYVIMEKRMNNNFWNLHISIRLKTICLLALIYIPPLVDEKLHDMYMWAKRPLEYNINCLTNLNDSHTNSIHWNIFIRMKTVFFTVI